MKETPAGVQAKIPKGWQHNVNRKHTRMHIKSLVFLSNSLQVSVPTCIHAYMHTYVRTHTKGLTPIVYQTFVM